MIEIKFSIITIYRSSSDEYFALNDTYSKLEVLIE